MARINLSLINVAEEEKKEKRLRKKKQKLIFDPIDEIQLIGKKIPKIFSNPWMI